MTDAAKRRFERRLFLHAFGGRTFFYVPILVHHMVSQIESSGFEKTQMVAMCVLSLFSIGLTLAEYPSGVFADWAGRVRSLLVGTFLHAVGVLLFLLPGSIAALAAAQLVLGVAMGFRSGADTALLYSHLERAGEVQRYGGALAWLRFWNVAGLTLSAGAGGLLYAWAPSLVFVASSVFAVACTLPLLGIDEPPVGTRERRYREVLRESLAEVRRNRPAQALIALGGVGTTYFLFAYWATQSFMVETGVSPELMGAVVAAISLLQAGSMPLAAWIAAPATRLARSVLALIVALPLGFAFAGLATRIDVAPLGILALVLVSGFATAYRNALNLSLQVHVPDAVRASILSLEGWLGAVWYVLFFPLGGWLIDSGGAHGGYVAIALLVALSCLPLLRSAQRRGAWTPVAAAPAEAPVPIRQRAVR